MTKVIHIAIICSPLDDARGSKATIRGKKETIKMVKETLQDYIPVGYRCSLVVATKEDE